LPNNVEVKIIIHDISGRIVKTLLDETQDVGSKPITWNEKNETGVSVAMGIYFYKIEVGGLRQTKKESGSA
jgi:flagellar hook assembly protein FlgD